MAKIGTITTSGIAVSDSPVIPIDESVCGFIFDISLRSNVFTGHQLAFGCFGNEQCRTIKNISEAEEYGIDSSLMSGVPYYHLSKYYEYYGSDKEIYVMFANLSVSPAYNSPIENMLMASGCKIYQVGIWTEQSIFEKDSSEYKVSGFVDKVNEALEMINGTDENPSNYPSGISAIVCGGTYINNAFDEYIDYRDLPDCKELGYKNVSLLIGQDTSSEVKTIQAETYKNSQVGLLGYVMACLTLAYAEENIAYVGKFNLNKSDAFSGIEMTLNSVDIPIENINKININALIEKGYIFPIKYEAKEGGIYLSGDSTLGDGVFGTLSGVRVIHKFRRVTRQVLCQYGNAPMKFNGSIVKISDSDVTILTNMLNDAINRYMVNSDGYKQVKAYDVYIDEYQDDLKNDVLSVSYTLATFTSHNEISFVENYKTA